MTNPRRVADTGHNNDLTHTDLAAVVEALTGKSLDLADHPAPHRVRRPNGPH